MAKFKVGDLVQSEISGLKLEVVEVKENSDHVCWYSCKERGLTYTYLEKYLLPYQYGYDRMPKFKVGDIVDHIYISSVQEIVRIRDRSEIPAFSNEIGYMIRPVGTDQMPDNAVESLMTKHRETLPQDTFGVGDSVSFRRHGRITSINEGTATIDHRSSVPVTELTLVKKASKAEPGEIWEYGGGEVVILKDNRYKFLWGNMYEHDIHDGFYVDYKKVK